MSSTIIYGFSKEGEPFFLGATENAWRGGMAIWRELEERHLPPYYGKYDKTCPVSRLMAFFDKDAANEIWDLAKCKNIPIHERIVLHTTFDRCLVKAEDVPKVIDAFRKFGCDDYTSLLEQADILEKLPEDTIAVGWNQTSVNGEDWSNKGGYDEENDEPIPYNCLTMNEHYWLFDELEV